MRRIRVLEIISGFAIEGPLGGIERFGLELSQTLDAARYAPLVCGLWEYGTPFEHGWISRLRENGIDAFVAANWENHAPYRSFWQAFHGIRRAVEGRVDIIHSHCQFGDVIALLLKRPLGARVLVRTVHSEREWVERPLRRLLLTEITYPFAFDAEVGVARKVVENLDSRAVARLLRRRSILIHNGVNLGRFGQLRANRGANRTTLGLPEEAWVVGSVARLAQEKGHAVLLDAAALVLRRLPQTHFLIVGAGELDGELKRHAGKLGIGAKVTFTGPRGDIEELMSVMDVFVSSSLREALPTAVLEAMVAKVPVVATRVSGSSEVIEQGSTGLLVSPGHPKALAHAIELLLTKRGEAAAMSTSAYRYVVDNFSIGEIAQQHDIFYATLLRGKNHP